MPHTHIHKHINIDTHTHRHSGPVRQSNVPLKATQEEMPAVQKAKSFARCQSKLHQKVLQDKRIAQHRKMEIKKKNLTRISLIFLSLAYDLTD